MTLNELIHFYLFNCGSANPLCPSMIEEMNLIKTSYNNGLRSIDDILHECVCNRHGHQYCIPNNAVNIAVIALMKSKYIGKHHKSVPFIKSGSNKINGGNMSFSDFEDLHDFVRYAIGSINGIGPLTVYDTAKRIGHILTYPVYPQEYVYLSAGAMDGAQALLGCSNLNFREPIEKFQPYFGTLGSIFVEDILCIFKDVLKTNTKNTTPGKSACIKAWPYLYSDVIDSNKVKKCLFRKWDEKNVESI